MTKNEKQLLAAELYKLSPTAQALLKKFFAEFEAMKKSVLECNGDFPHEVWRDIKGYEGIYQVSNFGRVKSFHSGKETLRKPVVDDHGYFVVVLYKNGAHKQFRVHVLVAQAFIPNPDGKPIVNHKDGNKQNCNVENLEWVTFSENIKHAYDTALMPVRRGTSCPNSKLSAEDVVYIRENYIPGDRTFGQAALARKFNVSISTIYTAVKRIRYTDVI